MKVSDVLLENGSTAVTDLSYESNGNLDSVIGPLNLNGERYRLDYDYDSVAKT